MLGALARSLFGTANDRIVKGFDKPVAKINALEPELAKLTDEQLRAKTTEFRERLAKGETLDELQAEAFAVVREAVERELGKPIGAVFSEFAETPLASASLAQVHAAKLLDGTEVAVKVQYPDIEDIVRTDLRNMERACRVYERFDPQPLELLPLLRELTTHTRMELDMRREAASCDRVRELFADDPRVWIPRIHHELSTGRVLVMERVAGIKITDKPALEAAGLDVAWPNDGSGSPKWHFGLGVTF